MQRLHFEGKSDATHYKENNSFEKGGIQKVYDAITEHRW